jgi:replicative DNA helicase
MIINNPPHNLDAEQAILSALLKDVTNSNCRQALDLLSEKSFYSSSHRTIYKTILTTVNKGDTVDLLTIERSLEQQNELEQCGGFIYLAELMRNFTCSANVLAYVDLINKTAQSRDILSIANTINESVATEEPDELINFIENQLKILSSQQSGKEINHISEFGNSWLDELDLRIANKGGFSGLATGITDLDSRLAGFDKEALVVLAGRPSMGKTLLAQDILAKVGVTQNKPCMFFSMEMSDKQVYERFISGLSNVGANKIRTADLNDEDWGRLNEGMRVLNESNIYVDSDPRLSVAQIRARVRRQIAKKGQQALIVIDYLGLMQLPKADRHDLAIADVTSSLKNLAKEIKTPILLLAQANRATDQSSRPSMSNIKDSSAIEADADVVLFVHREEVTDPDTELKGVTELIIAKDRHNDGNGTVYLVKQNGGFKPMCQQAVAEAFHAENARKQPQKKQRGYAAKGAA